VLAEQIIAQWNARANPIPAGTIQETAHALAFDRWNAHLQGVAIEYGRFLHRVGLLHISYISFICQASHAVTGIVIIILRLLLIFFFRTAGCSRGICVLRRFLSGFIFYWFFALFLINFSDLCIHFRFFLC